jgi:hypothetical protein
MSEGMGAITVATPLETVQSPGWPGPAAEVAVVVSTHSRASLLSGLLDALEAQASIDVEVVIADNGSSDDTWSVLTDRCSRTPLRMLALRLPFHDGPGVPRNTCVASCRAAVVAFTDDDCLPTPGWLACLMTAIEDTVDAEPITIVQGATSPEPGGWAGAWGRTLSVPNASGLYETANLAVRRTSFAAAGGFGAKRLLSGRAFGEDVVLGAAIASTGGFRFTSDALVHHRVMPGTYADFLVERRRLYGFPMLLRQVPELRGHAFGRAFLSRRSAVTDLALVGIAANIAASALTGSGWPGLFELAALPWVFAGWREAEARPGRSRLLRALQLWYADLVGAAALMTGSLRARRLLI